MEDLQARAMPTDFSGWYDPDRFLDVHLRSDVRDSLRKPQLPHFPGVFWHRFNHGLDGMNYGKIYQGGSMRELQTTEYIDGFCWRGKQRHWNRFTGTHSKKIPGNGLLHDIGPDITKHLSGETTLDFEF